jgi:BirA family biotin operon repressor/biotin-[acetyl-CoA-carboxylase] ligase
MPFDIERVKASLPDRRIDWYPSIGSTMTEASRLAASGCASGTVVGADEQTAGIGRYGRTWHSEPDCGVYVSMVLRYPFSPGSLPVVTLALGLATTEAILKTTDLACDLRWPNDVLIQSKKCAGINVNHSTFPPELSGIATSLRIGSGRTHSRERLLVELINSVESFCSLLQKEGRAPILAMFARASSFVHGRKVSVDQGDSVLRGTTAGLTESGFLILQSDDGKPNVIVAGGVRPCS